MNQISLREALFHQYNILEFELERAKRYHRKRSQFLFQFDRLAKFAGVLSGSYLILNAIGQQHAVGFSLGVAASMLGLATLIFRISERASEHSEAMRGFIGLQDKLAEIDRYSFKSADIVAVEKEKRQIEQKCFHEIKALSCVCFNETAIAFGLPDRIDIWWLQTQLAQYLTFQPDIHRLKGEAKHNDQILSM